jgi:uncharacterized protein DUF1415
VVLRFGVCPFAEEALKLGHVERRVVLDAAAAAALVDELAHKSAVEVALLIFPTVTMGAAEFDAWCTPLRTLNPEFAGAVFHPETPYTTGTAAQAVGFFRRAPDPTLQLVRMSALQNVRGSDGKFVFDFTAESWAELRRREHRLPTSERIARDNHALLCDRIITLQAIYDDIRGDRERSYGGR